MTPQEVLDKWDETTPVERRKEIYETLMGIPEFGDFLGLMKELQTVQRMRAQDQESHRDTVLYLGSAWGIDVIKDDIAEVLEYRPARM